MNPKQLDQLDTIKAILLDVYQDKEMHRGEKFAFYTLLETAIKRSCESIFDNVPFSNYQSNLDTYCQSSAQLHQSLQKFMPDIP